MGLLWRIRSLTRKRLVSLLGGFLCRTCGYPMVVGWFDWRERMPAHCQLCGTSTEWVLGYDDPLLDLYFGPPVEKKERKRSGGTAN